MPRTDTITPAALAALAAATCFADGPPRVVLPPRQLDRKTYQEVDDVLTRLGGKWDRKARAHLFGADPTADLAAVLAGGEKPADNPLDFYETPECFANELVKYLGLPQGEYFCLLEPSAGQGALIEAVLDAVWGAYDIVACEIDPKRVAHLRKEFWNLDDIRECDFLNMSLEPEAFTHVLMNPPFTSPTDPQAYMSHVEHAFSFLVPGGVLVSVVPNGAQFGSTKRHIAFRALVDANGGEWFPVPEGTFKASGTGVNVAVLRMRRAT